MVFTYVFPMIEMDIGNPRSDMTMHSTFDPTHSPRTWFAFDPIAAAKGIKYAITDINAAFNGVLDVK
ncbi:hypothetical protein WS46_27140 [Burkholderia sp. RF4-BP95]|nr:hypothetical protein WS46_27140 [Burkholderia sp. RF4-BP95]